MFDYMYKNAKMYYPSMINEAVEYGCINDHEIVFIFEDGSRVIYDDFDKTIRSITNVNSTPTADQYKKDFSIRLHRLLCYKGISQQELADLIGVDQSIISKYMRGTHAPSLYTACAIAKALNCSLNDLVYF